MVAVACLGVFAAAGAPARGGDTKPRLDAAQERSLRGSEKKLIEFGWDEPDTAFLKTQTQQLERSPFDGCVFHLAARSPNGAIANFSWLCWGKRQFTEAELAQARADLEGIRWGQFRDNFLRLNVTPADLDWFDDHSAILSNMRLAARIAAAGHCRGLLLDTEAYQGKLFDYHKQRQAPNRDWNAYAAQANRRGREVVEAFQDEFPGLTILVTFGHSLAWRQSDGGKKALADCPDGLLAPFLDGLIAASKGATQLVDGHELSYGFRDPALFSQARETMKQRAAGLAADPARYQKMVSAGFGLWLDYDWPKYGWKPAEIERNYFTPDGFETSLRAAIAQSDEFVWIYTEKPRWWSNLDHPTDLPEPYIEAVRRARRTPGARSPQSKNP
jgi:hypothetical protein